MHRTDAPGNVGGMFSAGDPANGILPTVLDEDWHNAVQENIVQLILGAGIALVKGDHTQLMDAVSWFIDNAELTPAQILAKLLTVDGSGSLLDTDLFRGSTPDQVVNNARVLAALGFVPARGNGFIGDSDLNTIIASGVYRFQHPLNGPSGVAWGQLLVLRGGSSIPGDSSDTIAQIVMDDAQSLLWCRSGAPAIVGGGGAWSPWREMVDTARLGAASFAVNGASMRRNGFHLYGPDNDGSGSGVDGDYLRGQTPDQVVSNARVLAALGFTPLGLADFTGSNQSLGSAGYQKLPGGMLLQWGTITLGDGAYGTWTFPTTFPTACRHVGGGTATEVGNSDAQANGPLPYGTATQTSCPFYCAAGGGPYTAWIWALGH